MAYPFLDLGIIEYSQAYRLQQQIWQEIQTNQLKGLVILAEHENVFTLGRLAKEENILVKRELLEKMRIKLFNVERGGDVTYHGPGQIVLYPIINLNYRKKDLKAYIHDLEEVIIRFIQVFGIDAFRKKDYVGVWTKYGKIASLGISVRKWISFHGVSVNINPEKKYFSYINPCGLDSREMTSLFDIVKDEIFKYRLKPLLQDSFNQIFN